MEVARQGAYTHWVYLLYCFPHLAYSVFETVLQFYEHVTGRNCSCWCRMGRHQDWSLILGLFNRAQARAGRRRVAVKLQEARGPPQGNVHSLHFYQLFQPNGCFNYGFLKRSHRLGCCAYKHNKHGCLTLEHPNQPLLINHLDPLFLGLFEL